ncbi:GbsR/MarR family transcriptional regulator [Candidatus Aenigmatarchaeota archaeon]
MSAEKDIEKKIFSTFSDVANALGYSPLHGGIIGALLVKDRPMSLQEIATETGYSISMISLSLDLLEVLGTIKRVKKTGDRKLYVELYGDLLEALKNAIIIKVKKSIEVSLSDFQNSRKKLDTLKTEEKERLTKKIEILEKEVKRLGNYLDMLSEISLP